jgi:hypothetical protein
MGAATEKSSPWSGKQRTTWWTQPSERAAGTRSGHGEADCPFCRAVLPARADKRGGRYFRCGVCLIAFFCSGREVIEQLDTGGTFALL